MYDAVIIGAGPAGCVVGSILAEAGKRVVIVEKERFPRYKVGESMIPYCYFPLERIGVIHKIKAAGFQQKHSVQFAATDGRCSAPFYFHQHMDHDAAVTWQVDRAAFDQIMVDHARGLGVEILQETQARELLREGDRVAGLRVMSKTDGAPRDLPARVTVDASGRDNFAIRKNNWRVADPVLKKVALWNYFKGAKRDEGLDEGATTIAYLPDKGWFWYLPINKELTSVGIVAEKDYVYREGRDPAAIFAREMENNLWIKDHLQGAEPTTEYKVTSDYSYRAKHIAEDGLVLAGDAFAFLDPVFSSGLFLALVGGELCGDAVLSALNADDVSASRFDDYAQKFMGGMEAFRKMVYVFYDHDFRFGDLVRKYPDRRGDLTDALIGNVFKDFEALFSAMNDFAKLPEPLKHGRPVGV